METPSVTCGAKKDSATKGLRAMRAFFLESLWHRLCGRRRIVSPLLQPRPAPQEGLLPDHARLAATVDGQARAAEHLVSLLTRPGVTKREALRFLCNALAIAKANAKRVFETQLLVAPEAAPEAAQNGALQLPAGRVRLEVPEIRYKGLKGVGDASRVQAGEEALPGGPAAEADGDGELEAPGGDEADMVPLPGSPAASVGAHAPDDDDSRPAPSMATVAAPAAVSPADAALEGQMTGPSATSAVAAAATAAAAAPGIVADRASVDACLAAETIEAFYAAADRLPLADLAALPAAAFESAEAFRVWSSTGLGAKVKPDTRRDWLKPFTACGAATPSGWALPSDGPPSAIPSHIVLSTIARHGGLDKVRCKLTW